MTALRRWLALGIVVVSGLGLAVELGKGSLPPSLVEHLSLSHEANVPTWFSSSLLLACAIVAGLIAQQAVHWRRHWWGVAIVLGYVSLDEAAEIHEHLGGLIGTHGILYFDWVIFAAAFLVVLAGLYFRFMFALPPATRNGLIIAAVIYVVGAAGMELPLGWYTERYGNDGLGYAMIDWCEETLEMIGATWALLVLLRHRARQAR